MRNIIIKEVKELLSDKKVWIGILTVLIILIIGTSYNIQKSEKTEEEQLRLGVINHDSSTYSRLLLDYFKDSEIFSRLVHVTVGSDEEIMDAFRIGKLDIYLIVPEDFAENMTKIKHSPVQVTISTADTTKAILFENILRSYEKYVAAVEENAVGLYQIMEDQGMDQALIDRTNLTVSLDLVFTALGKEDFFSFHSESRFPATTVSFYYISSILVGAVLYFGLYVGIQVLREMKQGTLARLCTTRTNLYQFLAGKMLVMVIALAATVSAGVIILCRKPLSAGSLLFCVAAAMFGVCQAVFISSLFPTLQRYILVGNLLIFYFAVIGGGIIPIQFLPQDLLRLSAATPYYYLIKGIILINQGNTAGVIKITLGFILLSLIICTAAAILLRKRSVIRDEV